MRTEVSPIPKTKNVTQYKEMRPISLLCHIGKIAEKIMAKHLWAELPDMPNQYAYTPTIGTTDALVKFTTDIVNSLDDKDCVAVRSLMLDFSKAFDRMRPEIAVNKILNQIATQLDLSEASLLGESSVLGMGDTSLHTFSHTLVYLKAPYSSHCYGIFTLMLYAQTLITSNMLTTPPSTALSTSQMSTSPMLCHINLRH